MFLNSLWIQNFRSHQNSVYEFNSGINFISGPNGAGKTNILEAIQVLATGTTFLNHSLGELINWDSTFATIQAKIETNDTHKLEVQLFKDPPKTTISRNFKLDDVKKTRPKYNGTLKTVVFQPDDLRLVTGSPSRRRDFLDDILSSLHWQYSSSRTAYNKALKHRNELLDLIYEKKATSDQLNFWDQELVKNGKILSDFRLNFITQANLFFKNSSHGEIKALKIAYEPNLLTIAKLESNYELEIRRGSTQSGPHRDDYVFHSTIFSNQNTTLESWGSRGQERLAILAFKLAQIDYIKTNFNQSPILLLDDIFSELDLEHWELVLNICQNHQSFITSAQPELAKTLGINHTIFLD